MTGPAARRVTKREYSLLLVLIGAAALFVLTTMGQSITSIFKKIGAKLEAADGLIS